MLLQPNISAIKTRLWFLSIFLILASCNFQKNLVTPKIIVAENIHIVDTIAENSQSISYLAPYKDSMKHQMMQEVFKLDTQLSNQYTVGNLGNITADYMFISANNWLENNHAQHCDFAVLNNGSIRNSLSPGTIFLQNIYEAMPYENELVIVKLTAAQTDSLFAHIALKNGAYLSNANCTINLQKPENSLIQGNPVSSKKDYWIAINSYMWLGGDGYQILTHAKESFNTNLLIRDLLINGFKNEFKATGKINPQPVPRIKMMQNITNRH